MKTWYNTLDYLCTILMILRDGKKNNHKLNIFWCNGSQIRIISMATPLVFFQERLQTCFVCSFFKMQSATCYHTYNSSHTIYKKNPNPVSSISHVKKYTKKCKNYTKASYIQVTADNMFTKLVCIKYIVLFIWNFVWGSWIVCKKGAT